jgi:Tfp pilus assembly protein PilN
MIRINLVPQEELDNPHWYVPYAVFLLVVLAAGWFAASAHIDAMRNQVSVINASRDSFRENYSRLEPDLLRFSNLQKNKAELSSKLAALQAITVTKISRFKPILVLEHLLNLRPDGVWFSNLTIPVSGSSLTLQGFALDHVLVSEFAALLKATASQDADAADLRTQVYFDDVQLQTAQLGRDGEAQDLGEVTSWTLNLRFAERGVSRASSASVSSFEGEPFVTGRF